jgi:hypothetical protein
VGWHTSQRLACSGSEEYQSREQSGAEVRDGGSGGSRREQHITGGGFEATELLVDLEEEGHERSREEEEEGGGGGHLDAVDAHLNGPESLPARPMHSSICQRDRRFGEPHL